VSVFAVMRGRGSEGILERRSERNWKEERLLLKFRGRFRNRLFVRLPALRSGLSSTLPGGRGFSARGKGRKRGKTRRVPGGGRRDIEAELDIDLHRAAREQPGEKKCRLSHSANHGRRQILWGRASEEGQDLNNKKRG